MQLEIIRATEFVRVSAEGHFDLAASKALLAALGKACRKRGIQHAVIDLRALQAGPRPVFTQQDLLELVNVFTDAGFVPQFLRLAILYTSDPHKRARLFAFLSNLHGWNVRAFGSFESALLWLSGDPEPAAQPAPAVALKTIPVRFRRRELKTSNRSTT